MSLSVLESPEGRANGVRIEGLVCLSVVDTWLRLFVDCYNRFRFLCFVGGDVRWMNDQVDLIGSIDRWGGLVLMDSALGSDTIFFFMYVRF